jgi:hypothetical protein
VGHHQRRDEARNIGFPAARAIMILVSGYSFPENKKPAGWRVVFP